MFSENFICLGEKMQSAQKLTQVFNKPFMETKLYAQFKVIQFVKKFKAKYQQDWAFYGAMASSRFEDFISKD